MTRKERELYNLREDNRRRQNSRLSEDSKDRLKKISDKKFRTCFVFAICEFENAFGEQIWGHGLDESQLTEQQKQNREKWAKVRKNILDKGNTQSRALSMEIDLHRVDFMGYRIEFGGKLNDSRK